MSFPATALFALSMLSVHIGSCSVGLAEKRVFAVKTFTSSEAAGLANAYLVLGAREAMLIDAVQTREEATRLADWIAQTGVPLRRIFITHAHADHILGLEVLAERFPNVPIVSTANVAADVRANEATLLGLGQRRWGANGPRRIIVPEALTTDGIPLDDRVLQVIEFEGAESAHAATLYEPVSRIFFASDLVAGGVHLNVREKRIDGWLRQLEHVEQRLGGRPAHILPGHGPAGGLELIDETRTYLREFESALRDALPEDVLRRMRARYPRHRLEQNLERGVAGRFPG